MRWDTHLKNAVLYSWSGPWKKNTKNEPVEIKFIRWKEAVYTWNVIGHEKAKYKNFLSELCLLKEGDECTLHYEFSKTLTEKSERFVTIVFKNIYIRGNPFNISKPEELINWTICFFLRYMTMINVLILTCRKFGLFLVKVTPEPYFFFKI